MVPRGGVVVWATVKCTDMLMQARALSIARVCVMDIYIVLSAGKLGVKCSAAKHMVSLSIVCRYAYDMYEGFPDYNKPARQMAHIK